jgi:hypothetical protein
MGDQLRIRATTTRTLTFNRIRTSQAGVYACRATINIQGIDSLSWTANQTVHVQSKYNVSVTQSCIKSNICSSSSCDRQSNHPRSK